MISQPLSHSATHVAQETSVRQTLLFTTHVSMHERAAFFRHSHELTAAAMNSHLQLQIHTCSHLLTATNSHLQPITHSYEFTPAAIYSQLRIHTCSQLLTATNLHLQPITHSYKFTPAAIYSQLRIHTCSHSLTATNSHLQPFTHSHVTHSAMMVALETSARCRSPCTIWHNLHTSGFGCWAMDCLAAATSSESSSYLQRVVECGTL